MFETGKLQKCHLSFYLKQFAVKREKMLDGLFGRNDAPFRLPTRLCKIPPDALILTDRDFASDAILYPNLNGHLTPAFVRGRDQFDIEEILADKRFKASKLYLRSILCPRDSNDYDARLGS